MVFPAPFLKVVMIGTMYTESEIWTCSLSMLDPGGLDNQMDEATDPYVEAIATWFANPDSRIASAASLTSVKANIIGTDGRYVSSGTTREALLTDPIAGGGGSATPAPQTTLAISLGTAQSRGAGSKGRFYPPLPSSQPGFDGRISESQVDTISTAAATLINDLNLISQNSSVVIASEVGTGLLAKVTSVRVGRVIDTQRRRRNALSEDYVRKPVDPS